MPFNADLDRLAELSKKFCIFDDLSDIWRRREDEPNVIFRYDLEARDPDDFPEDIGEFGDPERSEMVCLLMNAYRLGLLIPKPK